MTAALIFLDTETTGLAHDDDVWEFAAIRRDPDGREHDRHWFIEHDPAKAARLPESFRADYDTRYDPAAALSRKEFAQELSMLFLGAPTEPRAHVVGAVPNFDTEHLARILREELDEAPPWHHHLIDVETLAIGWLTGRGLPRPPALPWDSDDVSRCLGLEPPSGGVRHTAMGDVVWVRDIYDRVMGEK